MRRLLAISGMMLVAGVLRADPAADEQLLRKSGAPVDGPGLVKFLRTFAPADVDPASVKGLIDQLASDDFSQRELAVKRLLALGPRATPFLRQAIKSPDREAALRAEHCLQVIDGGPGSVLHAAALRLIAHHKPADAAAAVLEYLPFAPNDRIVEEAVITLAAVGKVDGNPAAALLAALKDKSPAKRAASLEALCKIGAPVEPMKPLLADPDTQVRLRAGLSLAPLKVRESVPALIALLDQVPRDQTGPIEAILFQLAADKAPVPPSKEKWAAWWRDHGDKVDLARLTDKGAMLGFTILASANEGVIREIDAAGKERWRIQGLVSPRAFQMIGPDRILVAEYTNRRITERDTKGEIKWEAKTKTTSFPLSVQRLANGNTFMASRLQIMEVNPQGNIVFSKSMTGNYVIHAHKLKNGEILALTSAGQLLRMDNKGAEISRFPVGFGVNIGCAFDVTPAGNILLPQSQRNKIVEYTPKGEVVREVDSQAPTAVQHLPNGNLLVSSNVGRVVEINARGQVVWEHRSAAPGLLRAVRR